MSDPRPHAMEHRFPEASLDIENAPELILWLRETGRIGPVEQPIVRILQGGVSNRTVRIERPGGEAWVIKQALAVLRVAVEWRCSPERVHREALGMQWLARLAPRGAIPAFLFEDTTHHLVAMEAVPPPHETWKSLLLRGVVQPDHVRAFGHLLGTVHHRARARADPLAREFGDRSIFHSLRLEPFYEYPAERLPAAEGFLRRLVAETRSVRETLVHGDYSPKNILVRTAPAADEPVLVLIDHEVIHWGDPMFDVGFALAHLLSKAHHLPAWRDSFRNAAIGFWQAYQEGNQSGLAPQSEARAVRHALACLLARAAGRSPLEYLGPEERERQVQIVTAICQSPPGLVSQVINDLITCFHRHGTCRK